MPGSGGPDITADSDGSRRSSDADDQYPVAESSSGLSPAIEENEKSENQPIHRESDRVEVKLEDSLSDSSEEESKVETRSKKNGRASKERYRRSGSSKAKSARVSTLFEKFENFVNRDPLMTL